MPEDFNAHVQYDDMLGTSAVDMHDADTLGDFLRAQNLLGNEEIVIGLKMYSGEVHTMHQNDPVNVTVYVYDPAVNGDISQYVASSIPVREVEFDVGLSQFFGFFKRFEVAFSRDYTLG